MEAISSIQKFWLVWNDMGRPSTRKHWEKQEAVTEAERLAAKHPGETFVVLKSVYACKTPTPQPCPVLLVNEDEIPF